MNNPNPRIRENNPWRVQTIVDRLKTLWTDTNPPPTFKEVAQALNEERHKLPNGQIAYFTRNAIGGKLDRLGLLTGRVPRPMQKRSEKDKAKKEKRKVGRPCKNPMDVSVAAAGTFEKTKPLKISKYAQTDPIAFPFETDPDKGVPFLKTKAGQCRWPIGERKGRLIVCGCPTHENKSYCVEHYRISRHGSASPDIPIGKRPDTAALRKPTYVWRY